MDGPVPVNDVGAPGPTRSMPYEFEPPPPADRSCAPILPFLMVRPTIGPGPYRPMPDRYRRPTWKMRKSVIVQAPDAMPMPPPAHEERLTFVSDPPPANCPIFTAKAVGGGPCAKLAIAWTPFA